MGRTRKYETNEEYLAANRVKSRERYYKKQERPVPPLRSKPESTLTKEEKHKIKVYDLISKSVNKMVDYYELTGGQTQDKTLARMATEMVKKILGE
jgi:hypothetical protein